MDARPRRRRARTAEEAAATLRKAWCRLRLSARDPARVPPWDAVVLTAASPQQAALYNRQLERARALGRFPASTAAIAVPDPDGARIGSGAATLHAVAALVRHLAAQVPTYLPALCAYRYLALLYSDRCSVGGL
jgi:fucokinase